jgi:hypothetical protein
MHTVTTPPTDRPAYGTVEHFAAGMRSNAARPDGALREALLMGAVLGPIQSITRDADHLGADRAIELIRNVFAAEALVRAEVEAAS